MAIRLPTVANIDYYDPNKQVEVLVWNRVGSVALPKLEFNPDREFTGKALTGGFGDSGLHVSHNSESLTNLPVKAYLLAGLVVPGPSSERNDIPLTYGVSMSLHMHMGVNDRIPHAIPVVASVKTFAAGLTQEAIIVKGVCPLGSWFTINQTSDCSAFNHMKTQLTYNTYGTLTRVFFGYLIWNPWTSQRGIDDMYGSISVNALHHLREIFDPNLG